MKCSRCRTRRSPNWHDGPVGLLCCDCFVAMEKREEMILANMPLVSWVVNHLDTAGDRSRVLNLEREDAWGWGVQGLIQAVDAYDPDRGSTWASYAVTRIRGTILDASRRADPLTRAARQAIHLAEAAAQELTAVLGDSPARQEIADALGLTAEDVAAIERDAEAAQVPWEALGDWAEPEAGGPGPEAVAVRGEEVLELQHAMAALDDRDGILLELLYRQGVTRKEAGRMMGISESRVCGLHKRALARLRGALMQAA